MTILSFDYGTTKIGVAVGNSLTGTARPLTTLDNRAGTNWQSIQDLIDEWNADTLIVGLPLTEQGEEQTITRQARKFAASLQEMQSKPVELVDERYSSQTARANLAVERAEGVRPRRLKRGDIDAEAAAILLRNWLAQ